MTTASSIHRGFTLIEMVVVVLIVSILASAAMPLAALHKQREREATLRQNLRVLRTALDDYKKAYDQGRIEKKVDASGYPPNLEVLVKGVKVSGEAKSGVIYFLRRIPRDPFGDPELADAKTWGLRSYASSPDSPMPGADVFDVYSTSDGVGLDGTPYKSW